MSQVKETKDSYIITVPKVKPFPSSTGKMMHNCTPGQSSVQTDAGQNIRLNLQILTPNPNYKG